MLFTKAGELSFQIPGLRESLFPGAVGERSCHCLCDGGTDLHGASTQRVDLANPMLGSARRPYLCRPGYAEVAAHQDPVVGRH